MRKFTISFKAIMFICLLAVVVLSVVAAFTIGEGPSIVNGLNMGEKNNFAIGWANQFGRAYEITEMYNYNREIYITQPFYLYKTVPELDNGNTLFMHSNNVVINLYLDGEPIHITNVNGDCGALTAFDNYISVDLPYDSAGKQLTMEVFKTKFSIGFCVDTCYLGSGQDIMSYVVLESFFPLISAIIFTIVGIGFIFLGAFIQKDIEKYRGYIFFGIFLILMSVCFAFDNILAYFAIDNIYIIECCVKLFMFAAMPPLMMFIEENYEMLHFLPTRITLIAAMAAPPLTFLLHITGIVPYTSTSIILHVCILISAIVLLVELISFMNRVGTAKLGKQKFDYIAMIIFIFMTLFDIGRFYQGNGGKDYSMTRMGLYVLTIAIAFSCFGEVVVLIRYGMKASKIEKIAFTDANTGIGNLAAFRSKFDDLERTRTNYKYIAIIQFDVNNLKVINDTKGHEAGDLLIKEAATVINQAFGPIGWCYRTGGDEFVAMTTYNHAPVACDDAIIKFEGLIDRFNKRPNKPFDLYIAYGIAYYQGDDMSVQNKSLKEIHKLADERMYNKKKELKARYAKTPEEAVIR